MDPARAIIAIPVSDPGLKFHNLVCEHVHEFDRSGGNIVWWQPMGTPNLAGPIYKALRSPDLAERDRLHAEEYSRRCQDAGGEDHYLRETYLQLAKKHNVPDDQRPLVVFLTDPPGEKQAILAIAPSSLDDGNRCRDLACFLHQQLQGDRILKFAQDDVFTPESIDDFQKYTSEMAKVIAGPIARGRGLPNKMWDSYSVAIGLSERPDPKTCTSGEAELAEATGVVTLRTFTDGVLDGETKFTALNPNSAKQRQIMMLMISAWPRGVHLKTLVEEAYGREFHAATDDAAATGACGRNIAQMFRDIRNKKLAKAHINPDVLPTLNSPACKRGMVALRLAKLKRTGFDHKD
jgi:hypothetical protein